MNALRDRLLAIAAQTAAKARADAVADAEASRRDAAERAAHEIDAAAAEFADAMIRIGEASAAAQAELSEIGGEISPEEEDRAVRRALEAYGLGEPQG